MEKEESEQISLVEQSVKNAAKVHRKFVSMGGTSQFLLQRCFTTMYGADFEDYVNQVWADFLDMCQDGDSFSTYVQENFERATREYEKMRGAFLESVFKEWDSVTQGMSEEDFYRFANDELDKRIKEFQQKKDDFEKFHPGYPKLATLLRRPAQNMMGRLRREQQQASQIISIDADVDGRQKNKIEDTLAHFLSDEEKIFFDDYICRLKKILDEKDRKILEGKLLGRSQTEIADEMAVSNATISKRMKRIKEAVLTVIGAEYE